MNQLLPLSIDGTAIRQDDDGRYCINDLHRAAGSHKRHQPSDFLRSDQTRELVFELEKTVPQIPGTEQNQPVVIRQGGNGWQGTFVCKELVYAYAMWISPAFHLKVIRSYDQVASGYVLLPKDRYITMLDQLVDAQNKLVRALEKPASPVPATAAFGKPRLWTREEDETMFGLVGEGLGNTRIGYRLGRSAGSVKERRARLAVKASKINAAIIGGAA